jgi:hypothetical protein
MTSSTENCAGWSARAGDQIKALAAAAPPSHSRRVKLAIAILPLRAAARKRSLPGDRVALMANRP